MGMPERDAVTAEITAGLADSDDLAMLIGSLALHSR